MLNDLLFCRAHKRSSPQTKAEETDKSTLSVWRRHEAAEWPGVNYRVLPSCPQHSELNLNATSLQLWWAGFISSTRPFLMMEWQINCPEWSSIFLLAASSALLFLIPLSSHFQLRKRWGRRRSLGVALKDWRGKKALCHRYDLLSCGFRHQKEATLPLNP